MHAHAARTRLAPPDAPTDGAAASVVSRCACAAPASDAFCETTIGYTNQANGELFKLAYNDPALKVGIVQDTVGVELCGALKNIVAIGAGYVDGLGYGGNTKAAIIRIVKRRAGRTFPLLSRLIPPSPNPASRIPPCRA